MTSTYLVRITRAIVTGILTAKEAARPGILHETVHYARHWWHYISVVECLPKDYEVRSSSLYHGILLRRWALHIHLAPAAHISIMLLRPFKWGAKCTAETNKVYLKLTLTSILLNAILHFKSRKICDRFSSTLKPTSCLLLLFYSLVIWGMMGLHQTRVTLSVYNVKTFQG